ncbi:chemotaxis protein CheW [Candidatus Parabeggiatoa sp. HSG14]|uniref:chemotaxis protein CheW n=1 Tax=Candidatus Parabeggiatoa sp. HSG14 TaxID=3055593 RepID=UPI0025A8B86E|nr:chemotaxis protein CheW [Thiotrichales bacterium HSG14]
MPNIPVIRCLLIPIGDEQLLLPSAVIAEVFPYNKPEYLVENAPNWLLGIFNWRNQRIPLLSIENVLSLPQIMTSVKKQRTIILYGLESTQTMPFYAFLATDIPRSIVITEETLINPNTDIHTGVAFQVTIKNKETVWLPDLTYLETVLKKSQTLF